VKHPRLTFIGGGNMARSLAGGLINNGWTASDITLAEPVEELRLALASDLGVRASADNPSAVAGAGVVVLAVKPQVLRAACEQIAPAVASGRPLVVSIAAGVRTQDIARWLGGEPDLVRAMPNTPALVGSGASGLYATPGVDAARRDQAESILRAVGTTVWVEAEEQLDVVTALSGSGPAYFFYLVEALIAAAHDRGLPHATARLLALETALGSARLALESTESPEALRRRVTSPGGPTAAAIAVLSEGRLPQLVADAVDAAARRAAELGDLLGRDE